MNNKGFTLIELLVSIGLIVTISTIIVVNMTSVQTKEESQEYTAFKTKIETAACSYIDEYQNATTRDTCKESTSGCQISLSQIVNEGLIDSDLVDPKTNNKVSDEEDNIYIDIIWENNNGYKEKKCTFKVNGE